MIIIEFIIWNFFCNFVRDKVGKEFVVDVDLIRGCSKVMFGFIRGGFI